MTGLSSIGEVVSGFDCTVSQMWLNKENQIECSHDAMECIQNNTNQFRSGRFVPRDRIEKYQELFKLNTVVSEGCIVLDKPKTQREPISMDVPFIPIRSDFYYTP